MNRVLTPAPCLRLLPVPICNVSSEGQTERQAHGQ